jgi:hypothetical protein
VWGMPTVVSIIRRYYAKTLTGRSENSIVTDTIVMCDRPKTLFQSRAYKLSSHLIIEGTVTVRSDELHPQYRGQLIMTLTADRRGREVSMQSTQSHLATSQNQSSITSRILEPSPRTVGTSDPDTGDIASRAIKKYSQ